MQLCIDQIAFCGPGCASWDMAASYFRDTEPYDGLCSDICFPEISILSLREQRRLSISARMALGVAEAVLKTSPYPARNLSTVFASACGEVNVMHRLLEALSAQDSVGNRYISPTEFHNSVHNSPAGYWHIGSGSLCANTSIAASEYTVHAALIKTAMLLQSEAQPVLVVLYDLPFPEPLHSTFPLRYGLGVALLCTPTPTMQTYTTWNLSLSEETNLSGCTSSMGKALQEGNPLSPVIALLEKTAQAQHSTVLLPYGANTSLACRIEPTKPEHSRWNH